MEREYFKTILQDTVKNLIRPPQQRNFSGCLPFPSSSIPVTTLPDCVPMK